MALALAVASKPDQSRRKQKIRYSLTSSGNYATGGDVIDLTLATDPSLFGGGWGVNVPDLNLSQGVADKYALEIQLGTDLKTAKIKIYDTTSGNELAAGAYPAGLATALANVFLIADGLRF